jgi:hypothetical protein
MNVSTTSRRVASALLVAGAVALGSAGIARAAEELDVGQYDDCVHAAFQKSGETQSPYGNGPLMGDLERCCTEAGGTPKTNENQVRCEAPPEEASPNDTSPQHTPPPRAIPIPAGTQNK